MAVIGTVERSLEVPFADAVAATAVRLAVGWVLPEVHLANTVAAVAVGGTRLYRLADIRVAATIAAMTVSEAALRRLTLVADSVTAGIHALTGDGTGRPLGTGAIVGARGAALSWVADVVTTGGAHGWGAARLVPSRAAADLPLRAGAVLWARGAVLERIH